MEQGIEQVKSMLVVMKFGGSSLADRDKIFRAARRCAKAHEQGKKVIVVLSAMGNTTDELLEQAAMIHPNPLPRELDMLLAVGEQISAAFMALALQNLGIPAISLNAFQVKIKTTNNYGNARIIGIDKRRIKRELASGKIVLITGFQGVNKYNDYTTLGRGGSDTSAVAMAAAFHAEKCEIYTDVDGVYTEDPNKSVHARKLNTMTYDEMLVLAKSGAQVLEKRAVEMAKKYQILLEVKSSQTDENGTLIGKKKTSD